MAPFYCCCWFSLLVVVVVVVVVVCLFLLPACPLVAANSESESSPSLWSSSPGTDEEVVIVRVVRVTAVGLFVCYKINRVVKLF